MTGALQKDGLAGVTRPDGVAPRSATASADGACNAAKSIFTASVPPTKPLQTVSASSASVAADAPPALSAAAEPSSNAHSLALIRAIVSTRLSRFFRPTLGCIQCKPLPLRQSLLPALRQNDPSALPKAITASSASSDVTMPTIMISR